MISVIVTKHQEFLANGGSITYVWTQVPGEGIEGSEVTITIDKSGESVTLSEDDAVDILEFLNELV